MREKLKTQSNDYLMHIKYHGCRHFTAVAAPRLVLGNTVRIASPVPQTYILQSGGIGNICEVFTGTQTAQ